MGRGGVLAATSQHVPSATDLGQECEAGQATSRAQLFAHGARPIHLPGPSLPDTWPVILLDAVQASPPPGSLPDLMSEAS